MMTNKGILLFVVLTTTLTSAAAAAADCVQSRDALQRYQELLTVKLRLGCLTNSYRALTECKEKMHTAAAHRL
jgi:hypothetical protein